MKKILIIFSLLIIITGCGSSKNEDFACTLTTTDYITKVNAKVKDGKVIDATGTITFTDSEKASKMCSILGVGSDAEGNLECHDKEIIIKNYHKSLSSSTITKQEFIDLLKQEDYKCE